MTPLGSLIFGAIGLLFVALVGAAIWWALRGANVMTDALARDGWMVEKPGGLVRWSARRVKNGVAANIEVKATGGTQSGRSVSTHVTVATDTGADDVLVERKAPGFLAADGMLAAAMGFTPPPRWEGGSPAFNADYNAYASSAEAAARRLPPANQIAIIDYNSKAPQRVNVRFYNGTIEARWAAEPQNAKQLEGVVAMIGQLRRAGK